MSERELKNCPFDGGRAVLLPPTCRPETPYNPRDRLFPVVRCTVCYAEASGVNEDYKGDSAIAAWNRRTPSAHTEEWRPIESAPKDGTPIIAWFKWWDPFLKLYEYRPGLARWTDHNGGGWVSHTHGTPVLWMPLPPAPVVVPTREKRGRVSEKPNEQEAREGCICDEGFGFNLSCPLHTERGWRKSEQSASAGVPDAGHADKLRVEVWTDVAPVGEFTHRVVMHNGRDFSLSSPRYTEQAAQFVAERWRTALRSVPARPLLDLFGNAIPFASELSIMAAQWRATANDESVPEDLRRKLAAHANRLSTLAESVPARPPSAEWPNAACPRCGADHDLSGFDVDDYPKVLSCGGCSWAFTVALRLEVQNG